MEQTERQKLFSKITEWPDDGTDWDGISTPTLKKILENHEKAKVHETATDLLVLERGQNHKLRKENKKLKEKLERFMSIFQQTPYVRCCNCDHPMQKLTKPYLVKENFSLSSINYRVSCIHDEAGNDKTFGKETQYAKCKCKNTIYVDIKIPDELKEILATKEESD